MTIEQSVPPTLFEADGAPHRISDLPWFPRIIPTMLVGLILGIVGSTLILIEDGSYSRTSIMIAIPLTIVMSGGMLLYMLRARKPGPPQNLILSIDEDEIAWWSHDKKVKSVRTREISNVVETEKGIQLGEKGFEIRRVLFSEERWEEVVQKVEEARIRSMI